MVLFTGVIVDYVLHLRVGCLGISLLSLVIARRVFVFSFCGVVLRLSVCFAGWFAFIMVLGYFVLLFCGCWLFVCLRNCGH